MSVLDTFSLKGKVALMTGGAGLYGRQIVAALAEAGATTIIASRDVPALEQVAAEHRARGCDVSALPLDQGEEQSILALRDEIKKKWGRLDVLVNNAVSRPMKEGYQAANAAATFTESMQVNATGLLLSTPESRQSDIL
jgi:NAD(P)-dependent dehydrogenase (short-subunit alcohol dehydrogenase family)